MIRRFVSVSACLAGFVGVYIVTWSCPLVQAQDCRQSFNVDPSKTILLADWNGSGETAVMSCTDAETLRGQIFTNQLAYLSDAQTISADRVTSDIQNALGQIDQVQQDLANAQSD